MCHILAECGRIPLLLVQIYTFDLFHIRVCTQYAFQSKYFENFNRTFFYILIDKNILSSCRANFSGVFETKNVNLALHSISGVCPKTMCGESETQCNALQCNGPLSPHCIGSVATCADSLLQIYFED